MSTERKDPPGSAELFEALSERAGRGDQEGLIALCQEHTDEIRRGFPQWKQVPPHIRADPDQVQRYAHTLITVAQLFAQGGDQSLLELLTGPAENNPLVQWEQALDRARAAMGANEHQQAYEQLVALQLRTDGLTGSGAEQLGAITVGLLGQTCFHRGRVSEAVEHFEDALARCQDQNDLQGQTVYLAALFEAHRWLDTRSVAAEFATRLAALYDEPAPPMAAQWRERAATVESEPPVRVRVEVDRARYDPDALPPGFSPEGSMRFVFERNRLRLGTVAALLEHGRAQGSKQQLEPALASFSEAAAIDPHDPDPQYLRGQTLLHLRRFEEAAEAYRKTESLAPGWYHCRTDGWIAEQLAAGAIPTDAFEVLISLESATPEPPALARARQATTDWPGLAPLHLAEARLLSRADQRDAAEQALRAGLSAAQEPDVKTRILVELAQLADEPERTALMQQAIELGGNRVARAMAQVMLHVRPSH